MGLKKRVKGTFEKLVPISPEFYDTERDEDLVAPKNVLLPFNAFLLLSQWIAFIALMVYYSGPANYVKDTTIKTDYNFGYPKYNCTPMMNDPTWGHTFSAETCMTLSNPPEKGSNVKLTDAMAQVGDSNDPDFHPGHPKGYAYRPYPFIGGKKGLAKHHERTFDSNIYGTEGSKALKAFTSELKALNSCGSDGGFEAGTTIPNLGRLDAPWVIPSEPSAVWSDPTTATTPTKKPPVFSDAPNVQPTKTAPCQDLSNSIGQSTGVNDIWHPDSCYFNHSWPMLNDIVTLLGKTQWCDPRTSGCLDLSDQAIYSVSTAYKRGLRMPAPGDWTIAPCTDYADKIGSSDGLTDIMNKDSCYFNHSWPMLNDVLKLIGKTQWCDPNSNGCLDFNDQRIPTVSRAYKRGLNMCSITEDEAVKMFQAFRDKHLCNYAIANMPFSCESAEPPSIPQRFSLAYANSLLLYTVFSTICVKLFFAAKKEPAGETAAEMKDVPKV